MYVNVCVCVCASIESEPHWAKLLGEPARIAFKRIEENNIEGHGGD